eukprot:316398-Rhodomonas_salina.1
MADGKPFDVPEGYQLVTLDQVLQGAAGTAVARLVLKEVVCGCAAVDGPAGGARVRMPVLAGQ